MNTDNIKIYDSFDLEWVRETNDAINEVDVALTENEYGIFLEVEKGEIMLTRSELQRIIDTLDAEPKL